VLLLATLLLGAAVTEANGADRFFIFMKKVVTKDWSFSSSSEKGLKEVKLVKSSTVNLVLLLDLDDWLLKVPTTGEETCGDSMIAPEDKVDKDALSVLVVHEIRVRLKSWTLHARG
jgi:hypothetical protein